MKRLGRCLAEVWRPHHILWTEEHDNNKMLFYSPPFLIFAVNICLYLLSSSLSLHLLFSRRLFMKAKTKTPRCAECCWHTRSCAGENTPSSCSSDSLSSPAAHFVSLKKVPTSHLSVLDTFLILSPLLTPPHRRVRTQTHGAESVEEDEF